MSPAHPHRRALTTLTAVGTALALALSATACTGSPAGGADDGPGGRTTITFWHGWSAPSEVRAIDANIARFEKTHPHIKVHAVGGIDDDKLNQALRAGGSRGPDVVSSFETANVGRFCSSGALADLAPFIEKSGLDLAKTFPKPLLEYTEFEGRRCTMPLLTDAYGLYYNKTAFKEAGIDGPPKTWSEFRAVAKKLTKPRGDGYERVGFLPNYHGYENNIEHYLGSWGPRYFDPKGKASLALDPAVRNLLHFQQKLVRELGGYEKLERFRTGLGDEFGAEHPFHTGQVAMQLDGEWRLGMALDAKVPFEIGVAPMPVPDEDRIDYGKGFLSGTIMGVSAQSLKRNAAWELVRFMTTDTEAVVAFANDIRNVPSTFAALKSPDLKLDPRFKTFLDIARDKRSNTAPGTLDGGAYLRTLQDFAYGFEKEKDSSDLVLGLLRTERQIDADMAQARRG
ncbi:ABC transporter substrate-binding protein [Streptomyces sp. NPDC048718]|uniref:ABC transporter substrate-binding protein n=1 Tax=Streptomyces sp. NPDC048718 TaxID=3365587 RepID=UPI00371A1CF4